MCHEVDKHEVEEIFTAIMPFMDERRAANSHLCEVSFLHLKNISVEGRAVFPKEVWSKVMDFLIDVPRSIVLGALLVRTVVAQGIVPRLADDLQATWEADLWSYQRRAHVLADGPVPRQWRLSLRR